MLKLHTNFRGKEEWEKIGLDFTTLNDEALRKYDSVLTQYVAWYEEEETLEITLKCLHECDPNFFMGVAMSVFLDLIATGSSPRLDSKLKQRVDHAIFIGKKNSLNPREIKYSKSLQLLANGFMKEACDIWEEILIENPLDLFALKLAHDCYFYLGLQSEMRDSIARVIVHWDHNLPHYGFLLGMWSFGLCETGNYKAAELKAREALRINRSDSWATHALAHVFEMQGRHKEGREFMLETLEDWKHCSMLSCHNFWHFAVYHIENNDIKDALNLVDTEIMTRSIKSDAMLDIVDICSILQRLEINGIAVGNRWTQVYPVVCRHTFDHVLVFNDAHVMMCLLGCDSNVMIEQMMKSINTYASNETLSNQTNHKICQKVGLQLLNALINFKKEKFSETVEILKSIRYNIVSIGGSNAQRDVFSQLLICAAIKSPSHSKFARSLLIERKQLKNNSPLTDRLVELFEQNGSSLSIPSVY